MRDCVDNVFADARVQEAFRYISEHETEIEADQIRLTEIPAPPFDESERARAFTVAPHGRLDWKCHGRI